jgi:hypothetical protein
LASLFAGRNRNIRRGQAAPLTRLTRRLSDRQLQDGRALPFPQSRNQNEPAVRKLECIVMSMRFVRIDSSESRTCLTQHAKPEIRQQARERVSGFDLPLEDKLGTRRQADRDIWLSFGRKAARLGSGKSGR